VLLAAWERGVPPPRSDGGTVAFAIYDRDSRRLWLARDRFGEKPLYYHADPPGSLCFASSIPALSRRLGRAGARPRRRSAEYLTLRYVISPADGCLRGSSSCRPGILLTAGPEGVVCRGGAGTILASSPIPGR